MKSYTQGRNLYGVFTKNVSTTNLSYGDQEANDKYRHICSMRDWPFLERVRTKTTTAGVQAVELPYDCDQVREISVIPNGDTTRYVPKLSPSAEHWDKLNLSTFTSDIPEWYFVRAGQLLLWPTPVQTGNTIYITQKTRVIDMAFADVTNITVASITNGANTMVVSGSLTTGMAGLWIRVTYTGGVAATTGDGQWYEIAGIVNATTLTLVRAYGGTTIAAATAACTIGQMPLLPEAFHDTPWKMAASAYWAKEGDKRSILFQNQYVEDLKQLEKTWSSPTTDMVIDNGRDDRIVNPNLTIMMP